MNSDNEKKLQATFAKVLNLKAGDDFSALQQNVHPNWDSLRHVELFIAMSKQFEITFEVHEVLGLNTYERVREAVNRKLTEGPE